MIFYSIFITIRDTIKFSFKTFVFYILALILLYGTDLFWVSVVSAVLYLIFFGWKYNLETLNMVKRNEKEVRNMVNRGATCEDLAEFLEITDEDRETVPNWVRFMTFLTRYLSFVFLIAGVVSMIWWRN